MINKKKIKKVIMDHHNDESSISSEFSLSNKDYKY